MRRFFQFAGRHLKKTCLSPQTHALLVGATSGAMLLTWCFQWTARLGTSLAVISALSLAILVGIEQGFRPLKRTYKSKSLLCTILAALAVLATWTVSFPWLLDWQTQLLGAFSPLQLSQPWLTLAVCFGFALVIITPPVIVLARLPFCLLEKSRNAISPRTLVSLFLLGTAGGIVISAFALSPILGLTQATLLMTFFGCIATGLGFVRAASIEVPPIHEPESEANASLSPTRIVWEKSREIWAVFVLLVLGGLFAWSSRFVDQFVPVTVSLMAAKWSCLLLGWAIGFWGKSRKTTDQLTHQGAVSSFVLAAYGVTLAATFPLWLDLCLSMTVGVSNVFLLTLCRLALVFGIMAPLGMVWGRISAMLFQAQSAKTPDCKSIPVIGPAVLAGWLFTQWVFLPLGAPAQTVLGLCLAAMVLAFARILLEMSLPKSWMNRCAVAGVSLLLFVSLLRVDHYQPQSSAELLFAAPVFVAHQAGVDRELLTELDEGRHVASREGQQGTYTLWKYRGVQHQLRQNGLPKGMASGDVMLCPEYSAEVLPSAIPLVLHERPDTVLILGLGSGVSVKTALAFPTQEVTCVETDPALIELVKEQIWHDGPDDPTLDPRLTLLPVDPALLLRSKSEPFDVIVSIPHQAMVAETAAYFTETFYQDASLKLAEDGLFCQRLAFVDFGPDALRVAARTMQAVFQDVVFLEMAGGEMLLMGTNSPKGVAREGFLDRLQKQHVRRQLALLGWDWSVPLNLSAFNNEALTKFVSEAASKRTKANTLATGTFAFGLPGDMMRWGPKPHENQLALAPHLGRFAQWGGIDPQDPDLLHRLAEVTGQRNLMATHPDEYWAYRKTVRDQVTQRPRSVIVQVKGELPRQEIHKEEKRRLDYFRALGSAYQHKPPRLEDIAKVEAFAEPFDPLITFFLHQEVAELHSRSASQNSPAELAHRMHSIFFAAPGDRSIRNVIAAIELLTAHSQAVETPIERWDHLNAMLQMMKQRWAIRASVAPASTQVTLNDVDKSLDAVNMALKAMDELREEAGIKAQDWEARRRFVETTVVHPLRVYRRQLLPIHQRERIIQEKKQTAEED